MRLIITYIILLFSNSLFAQNIEDLNNRFPVDNDLEYPSNFIRLPKSINLPNLDYTEFDKEKTHFYIDYFFE